MVKNIFIFFLLFFASCDVSAPVAPDHIRMQLAGEPGTLHPLYMSDAYSSDVKSYLFDSLIGRDPDTFELIPKMAKSWEISPDRLNITFYLRDDVYWHDGKLMTADDVVYSFELLKNPKINAPIFQSYATDIVAVKKIDDFTIRFRLTKVYFKALLVCGATIPILPKHILEKEGARENGSMARNPVGNGPYRFVRWKTGQSIFLTRNEDYWGKKPEIKTIEFKIITDSAMALQILKKGQLDQMELSTTQWMKQTSSEKFKNSIERFKYQGSSYSYIGWNMNKDIFKDRRVRQALTYLIDREKLTQKLYYGLAQIAVGPFYPGSPQSHPDLKPYPHDPQKAKQLLAEAGWSDSNDDGWLDKDGKKFRFKMVFPAGANTSQVVSTIIKEDLRDVGIDMQLERLEWAAFLEFLNKKEFDATLLAWMVAPDSDPYQLWHSSQADAQNGSNRVGFRNREADRLIEKARREYDSEKRNKLYWRFQEIIHEEQPYTFLLTAPTKIAVSKRFKNIVVHRGGLDALEWQVVLP